MKIEYLIICTEEYLTYAKKAMFSLRLKDKSSRVNLFIFTNKLHDLKIFKPIIVTRLALPEHVESKDIGTYVCTRRAEIFRDLCTVNDNSVIFFLDADTLFLRRIKPSQFKEVNRIFVNVTKNSNPKNRVFLSQFMININKSSKTFSEIKDSIDLWAERLKWTSSNDKLNWFDDQITFADTFLNSNENDGVGIVKLGTKYGAYGSFLPHSFIISGAAGSKLNTIKSITPYGFCNSLISKVMKHSYFIEKFCAKLVLNAVMKLGYLIFIYLRLLRLIFSKLKYRINKILLLNKII
jgi:hypothetical protein